MKRWQKTIQSKWCSGKDNIYHKKCQISMAYIAMLKSMFTPIFYISHLNGNEDTQWPSTRFFFVANSALMVPINIFDDKVAEKAIESDDCTCYF